LGHLLHHRVGHSGLQIPGDLAAIHVGEMVDDVAGGDALGVEA
jgi:hypothetical protein